MDVIKTMFEACAEDTGTAATPSEGEATLTTEKIGEMIDSAAEQFKNSTLNNKTEIEALKESIDALTAKVNDISAKLESKPSDNIDTTNTATPTDTE